MRTVFFYFVAFILLAAIPAFANPESEEEPPPPVYFFVYTWPLPDTAEEDAVFSASWLYQTREEVQSLTLRDGNLSSKMEHAPGVPIVLFQESEGPDGPEGEPVRHPRARVGAEVIGDKRQILIILFPMAIDPDSGLHRVHVVDLSPETLPVGAVKFLNLADRDVFGLFGEENFSLPRLQERVFRIPSRNGGLFTARIAAHIENEPQFVYSTRRRLRPDQSYLMLLLNEQTGDRLTWRAMSFGGLRFDAPQGESPGE